MKQRIVAVGLLTQRNLDVLGDGLKQSWPVEEAPIFSQLLRAIDEADERLRSSSSPNRGTTINSGRSGPSPG